MCHGDIDPRILMQDAEARLRQAGAVRVEGRDGDTEIPADLMGGLRGVWARLARAIHRQWRTTSGV